ncbi:MULTISPECIES: glycosyltransferase family 4 protein [Pseudomonas]|uniref:glycosyltransferase family 4 protein n=1 Tax=Pseudomonas TaxID=286 RepID=UPI00209B5B2D|nr:glycosyltransferase family 4 protein [Pseudomonas guariconensis]MCO7622423.1 glycosyltransferase family 4 protein [Pseudomonas guariconensis]
MKPVLLIVGNDAKYFLSHRLPVALSAKEKGYDVHIATPEGPSVPEVERLGFKYHRLSFSRSGTNPLVELWALISICILCWKVRPKIMHLVTIKPVLYGGIAARISPVMGVLAAIPGLGFIFMAEGVRARVLRSVISFMYRIALGKSNLRAVFQNPDDQRALSKIGAISAGKSILIRGSGVDLSQYRYVAEDAGVPVVTFAARLLRDKGVFEFIDAARLLKARGMKVHFKLAGDLDTGNPTSVTEDQLANWMAEGVVECLGYCNDMSTLLTHSHLIVLPSYREGLPKVLVEAAACGRAVITTDVPGCRDAIDPDVSGLLVPVRDAKALADAIQCLLDAPERRREMGKAGRALAERAFAIESIVEQHMKIYNALKRSA